MTSTAASARQVVVLARAPSASGKTRLTAGWPEARARALRERLFLDTLAAARAAGYPVIVCFTPDTARAEMRGLAGEAALIAQRGDDLGARMRHAMLDALASGADAVVLVGSDVPTLPAENIVQAFDMLDGVSPAGASAKAVDTAESRVDIVFGPTEDGGFYLFGACCEIPDVFRGIDWGGPDVLAQSIRASREAGLMVGLAREWWDVDTPDDLQRWRAGE
ncbi:MAG TPA: TIGR04282 family arsenosugar biosynthesis glycosyltransferase [Vicinamibacterales bacterium]|nr:TIGR04282 family arsenosugar biosynthesis glycosyltransferase [Vicinamibacterales bacterium]